MTTSPRTLKLSRPSFIPLLRFLDEVLSEDDPGSAIEPFEPYLVHEPLHQLHAPAPLVRQSALVAARGLQERLVEAHAGVRYIHGKAVGGGHEPQVHSGGAVFAVLEGVDAGLDEGGLDLAYGLLVEAHLGGDLAGGPGGDELSLFARGEDHLELLVREESRRRLLNARGGCE